MKNHWSAPPAASDDPTARATGGSTWSAVAVPVNSLTYSHSEPGGKRRVHDGAAGRPAGCVAGCGEDRTNGTMTWWVNGPSGPDAHSWSGPGTISTSGADVRPRTSCASVSRLSTLSRSISSSLSPSASATYRGMRRRSRSRWTAANCLAPLGSRKAASSLSPRFQRARDRITPAADDAGQERRLPQRSPVPGDPGDDLLVLQRAQEAVDTETAPDVVVRGGEPGDDLAPEPAGAEHDPLALDRHEQVGQRQLPVGRRAGASQVRDLVAAQHGPAQDVADPSLREVHDLGEHALRVDRLLGRQVRPDELVELVVGVAEAAEQPRAGRSRRRVQHHLEVIASRCLLTVGHDGGQHLERVGQRRDIAVADGCGLGCPDRDLAAPGGERAGELVEQERVAAGPGSGLVLAAP